MNDLFLSNDPVVSNDLFVSNDLVEDPGLHEGVDEAGGLGEGALSGCDFLQNFFVIVDRVHHVLAGAVGQVPAGVGLL